MKKITSKKDARELARKLLDSKIQIQLFDEECNNKIITLSESEYHIGVRLIWVDTVNGDSGVKDCLFTTAVDIIYSHRKYINNSGQLEAL